MLIEVIRKGYKEGAVEDYLLGSLIEANKIIAFRRTSGWVTVGRDPVRSRNILHIGPERRRVVQGETFSMR